MTVWTIGHSTHEFEPFMSLLGMHGIELVADIRATPRSRRHPHFEKAALERSLPDRGVAYVHLPRLGGWRRPVTGSPNGSWHHRSFRGYADYAMGREFGRGLAQLRELAASPRVAAMCSEARWWRCHRRLVADHLVVLGYDVRHIASDGRTFRHRLPEFASVSGAGVITYPADGT